MDGVIVGGWGFVGAAWGLSLSLFVGYAAITSARLARARKERA
jgi:hypothetical protein